MTRPTYVYDLAALATHAAAVRAALPDRVELLYAVKANPDPGMLRTLAATVDGFEAASRGELRHLAAVLPDRRVAAFAGPGKTDADLTAALAADVHRVHVESAAELHRLAALARAAGRTVEVLLRVNLPVATPGAVLVMGGRPSPFGMDPQEAVRLAADPPAGVRIRGVHAHLASGLDAASAAAVAREVTDWAVRQVRAAEVNVGGGMAVDYDRPEHRFDWPGYGRLLGEVSDAHPTVRLRIEPGRAVAVYCGSYVTEVIDVKRSQGRWFVIVAGGTHHLRTPAAKGHSQPYTVVPRGGDGPRTDGGPVTVVGQLCTPKDVLAYATDGPAIAVGDVLVFSMAGAYAWNISHRDFLLHEPPEFRAGDPLAVAHSWGR
ncbi:alanine racemase [Micromonospora andamanensis]|uniref:alanine racemase n=1 Tax=Micromonospora andamanensis TaxID=1287068 RepID=UPI0019520939|nr:alanine racemase [Micromonospora andamanensis]GIJ38780.1 diaminopimelate decarboxylase [Micromonospora andamanensis]